MDEFFGLIPIANSLEGLKNRGTDIWIGVRYALDSIDLDSAKLPANYMFIDGASNTYFNVSMGRFPWRDNEPDNPLHECATTRPITTFNLIHLGWYTAPCADERGFICRRPCEASPEVLGVESFMNLNAAAYITSVVFFALILVVAGYTLRKSATVSTLKVTYFH